MKVGDKVAVKGHDHRHAGTIVVVSGDIARVRWDNACGDSDDVTDEKIAELALVRLNLGFGWNQGLVDGVKAAWGARWIVDQDGHTDIVWGRTDAVGDEALVEKTRAWLAGPSWEDGTCVLDKARNTAMEGLIEGRIHTRKARGTVLYQDSSGAVIANTNASAGYLYVTAYLFEALPDGHPTRGLERALNLTNGS